MKESSVFFKIIVPNYNNEQWLDKCLSSILRQSFKDYKVVVIDDMSTDSSVDIIKKYPFELVELDNLIKSRFVEMFGTIYNNKFGYEIRTLQDVCEQIKDGTHQTPTYTDDVTNGYKFLSSKDVTTGRIDWTHLKYIPEELHNESCERI